MPGMRSPAQQAPAQPVEYATQADVQVLAAEIRGLRESMEAELRTLRESMEAELRTLRESMEAELRTLRESMEARFNRVDARFDSLLNWAVGLLVGAMVGFGGLIFAAVHLITASG